MLVSGSRFYAGEHERVRGLPASPTTRLGVQAKDPGSIHEAAYPRESPPPHLYRQQALSCMKLCARLQQPMNLLRRLTCT